VLNYAVLHLSSAKPSEIYFEVTGYALVMKKIVMRAKRTHYSVQKYYNSDTNN